jgi:hypothetical protein|tara:strand:- start:814 stop:1047 length:234 start_codon:yes stop_codon:yes gene_type:complete
VDIEVNKVSTYYELTVHEGNAKITSGLYDYDELSTKTINILGELLYYADAKVFAYLVDEHRSEIEEIMSERREKENK